MSYSAKGKTTAKGAISSANSIYFHKYNTKRKFCQGVLGKISKKRQNILSKSSQIWKFRRLRLPKRPKTRYILRRLV
jgi:hypothetical protein